MSERSNWSCPYCDSSDVFRMEDGNLYECQRCELRISDKREATVNSNGDGDTLGVALFLSDTQLQAVDVDPAADKVRYWVQNGSLHVEGVSQR